MKQASHGATVRLYPPGIDQFLEDLTKGDDRVFYFEKGPETRLGSLPEIWAENEDQKTLEAFSYIGYEKRLSLPPLTIGNTSPGLLELQKQRRSWVNL